MEYAVVAGANGFVGSALVKILLENGVSVTAIDIKGDNLPKGVDFVRCDVADIDTISDRITIHDDSVFYHLAWRGTSGNERGDVVVQTDNVRNAAKCLTVAKNMGCKRFVFAGTIMEHEAYYATFEKGDKAGIGYIYGASKYLAHTTCKALAAVHGIEFVWAGLTNAYGVGELSPRLVNSTIRKIIKNEPLQFTSGTQNYDFVYIDDAARAFYLIGKNGKPFCEYIISSGDAKPLREFLLVMKASIASDRDFRFGDVPFSGVDLPLDVFDCAKTRSDTGFEAQVSFSDGVKYTMDWLVEYER